MAFYRLTIPAGPFQTVVADPPWPFKDRLPGKGRGAAKHYETMETWEIAAMAPDVKQAAADNAHLYLWTPNAFVRDAWGIAESWGFAPKTLITWVKVTEHAIEKARDHQYEFDNAWEALNMAGVVRIGMGRGYRNVTEHVIVATRGKAPMIRTNQPNVFFAPRQAHSRKPDIFYHIVQSMSPGPHLELFAGRPREGWTTLIDTEGAPNDAA